MIEKYLGHKYITSAKYHSRVVLLQGPVGPFFECLRIFLEKHGYDVLRICFHAGDRFFTNRIKTFNFKDGKARWADWFKDFIARTKPDFLVYFGSAREIHSIARILAEQSGVLILSLEEGYFRSGFITAELKGNNAQSPLAGLFPPKNLVLGNGNITPQRGFMGFRAMYLYGAQYYIIRTLFSCSKEKELFHRHFNPLCELFFWTRNVYRRYAYELIDYILIKKLLKYYDKRYFFIPLQVTSDIQLGENALGWNNQKLITQSLHSFARSAQKTHHILFKIHPLERGHSNDRFLIRKTAQKLRIKDRVHVIYTGSPSQLTAHASGMITINSTTGFLAIAHGVPLLVIGKALYTNTKLATCAQGHPDFDSFWNSNFVAEPHGRERYLTWIKNQCLKPGDFYAHEGMKHACVGILQTLEKLKKEQHRVALHHVA